jgi:hypothetical protein
MTTDNKQSDKRASLERIYRFMDRVLDIAQREFEDLSPVEIVLLRI